MRIAIISDTYPPMRTSGAVQLRDLAHEFVAQGHEVTMLIPSSTIEKPSAIEEADGVQIARLKSPPTKDVGYVRRTINEFLMPFAMRRNLKKSPLADKQWDAVIWYSPSIFHGPLAKWLKLKNSCKSYLIIRDIFPEWAVDLGIMRRGPAYRFFDAIARYQYSVADVIGVQTPGNLKFFERGSISKGRRLEVLQNWVADLPVTPCSISVKDGPLAGRKIFVYAGNMGIAQNLDLLIDLAEQLQKRSDIGFLFVGRGSEAARLEADAKQRKLDNVLFGPEIDPDEIPGLYAQCAAGLVSLDPRHNTHNIPGKFITYMQSGLPVLAAVNAGNDLSAIIRTEQVGRVSEANTLTDLEKQAIDLVDDLRNDPDISDRCKVLYSKNYSPASAVAQIVQSLS
jgi:glycosyltransferase involved in cell wall biosynthesis